MVPRAGFRVQAQPVSIETLTKWVNEVTLAFGATDSTLEDSPDTLASTATAKELAAEGEDEGGASLLRDAEPVQDAVDGRTPQRPTAQATEDDNDDGGSEGRGGGDGGGRSAVESPEAGTVESVGSRRGSMQSDAAAVPVQDSDAPAPQPAVADTAACDSGTPAAQAPAGSQRVGNAGGAPPLLRQQLDDMYERAVVMLGPWRWVIWVVPHP